MDNKKVRFLNLLKLTKYIAGVCFILLACIPGYTKGYSQSLSLDISNKSLSDVIEYIEKHSDYHFFYQNSETDLTQKVSIKERGSLEKVVKKLFKNTNLKPVFLGKQILLKPRGKKQKKISGYVTYESGDAFDGVNVILNDKTAISTDSFGYYEMYVQAGDKLKFSHVGFETKEFVISNQNRIDVTMEISVTALDPVILVGYQEKKASDVSGSIVRVEGKTIENNLQSGLSVDRGIEGLVKGVLVTQGSGEFGNNADVIIRGITSPFAGGNNNPLYVVDGVPLFVPSEGSGGSRLDGTNFNPLQTINPADIESISVLKDASATAIYGSRGANGVIIIKTKSAGFEQPTTINFSYRTTVARPVRILNYLDAKEFKEYILALNKNSYDYYLDNFTRDTTYGPNTLALLDRFGFAYKEADKDVTYDPALVKFGKGNTDWNKEVYRNLAMSQKMNISISGGGEKSSHGLSLGYLNRQGLLKADIQERYNIRYNHNLKLKKIFNLGTTINFSRSLTKSGFSSANTQDPTTSTLGSGLLRFRPDFEVYDKNGEYTFENIGTTKDPTYKVNPVGGTIVGRPNKKLNHSAIANVYVEAEPIKDLRLKAQYSFQLLFDETRDFQPKKYRANGYSPGITRTELSTANFMIANSTVDYTASYNTEINELHTVNALVGFSHNKQVNNSLTFLYSRFTSDELDPYPQGASSVVSKIKSILPTALNSYFTRGSYVYNDRYGINLVLRLDRSSRFAPVNRNAFFPSVSANWNIHNETFMLGSIIKELKLRASFGYTGSTNVSEFSYLQLFEYVNRYKGEPALSYTPSLANTRARWEMTREYNIGLNFMLEKSMLRGSLDLYDKRSSDVLMTDLVPKESGADQFTNNVAEVENRGVELSLGSDIINTKDFVWSVDLNASRNINKLLKISQGGAELIGSTEFYSIGREANLIRGYRVKGIIQNQETIDKLNAKARAGGKHSYYDQVGTGVGDYLFEDIDGDSVITNRDRVILGSRQPELYGGFNTKINYKGISLGVFFSYSYGVETIRNMNFPGFNKFYNIEKRLGPKYRWSPTNRSATLPRLIHQSGSDGNNRISDRLVYDASYIRLTALRIGYDLPKKILDKLRLNRFNIYVSTTNVFTWTNFPGIDPQATDEGSSSIANTGNVGVYPMSKTISTGVSLQF